MRCQEASASSWGTLVGDWLRPPLLVHSTLWRGSAPFHLEPRGIPATMLEAVTLERPRASQSPRPCPQDEADGPWPSDEGGYGEGQSRTPGAGFVWTDGTLADPTGDDGARLFQGLDSRTPGWWGWTRGPSGSHSPAAQRFGNSRTIQHPRERSAPKRMNGNQSWAWGAPEASLPPSLWLAGSRVAPP